MFYKIPLSLETEINDFDFHVKKFVDGKITSKELKHESAPFGVYEQRNTKFMIRIRCAAGMISPAQLKTAALLSQQFGGKEIHITTRQELQIHDVEPENIIPAIKELRKVGLASRGGGGNALRNILASWDSGISANEVFDVTPHAVALTNKLISEENSWKLPRKFKIAFANSDNDNVNARCTDVGFIAQKKNGRKGFKVYVAGGMGRKSQSGNILHNFILENEFYFVAEAIKLLFYKYGNRENRNQARLRFLWNSLGKEKFVELYNEEIEKIKNFKFPEFDIIVNEENKYNPIEPVNSFSEEFDVWKKRYVREQKQPGLFLVNVPFLFGNLKNKCVIDLAELLADFGDNVARFTIQQNIMLRNIPEKFLGNVYELIRKITPLAAKPTFIGNCIACTGSAICKIGIARPRELLKALNEKLEKSNLPLDKLPDIKVNLSGCPNSCAQHHLADLGFAGKIKSENGERKFWFSVFENAEVKNDILCMAKETDEIPEDKVVDYIIRKVSGVRCQMSGVGMKSQRSKV